MKKAFSPAKKIIEDLQKDSKLKPQKAFKFSFKPSPTRFQTTKPRCLVPWDEQPNVSKVLTGERELNLRQIRELAKKLKVKPLLLYRFRASESRRDWSC